MNNPTKRGHYLYNRTLRPVAGTLRKNMTKAEACLWKYVLRAGMMNGYTLNRQRPVMNYIVEFFCKRLCLAVEVDGITHQDEETFLKDRTRERELERAGFKVVRFTDEEVLKNIDGVRRRLKESVEEREKQLGLPPPYPLGEGDRH